MKKILFGFLGIMLTLAVVATSARALFSSTATVGTVTFATGNADLKVYNGTDWVTDWTPSDFNFSAMYPGYETYRILYLRNSSSSNIALRIAGKLRAGVSGHWAELKDVVWVNVWLSGIGETGYHSLSDWFTVGYQLPGGALAQNTQFNYRFYVKVDPLATNSISEKTLTGVNFDFTGTQVTP